MIFYFSGTGNSKYIAQQLENSLNTKLISISEELKKKQETYIYSIEERENIVFVFPVHSWGLPILVREFIAKLEFIGYKNQSIYGLISCGSDCAYTHKILRKTLKKQALILTDIFSIVMPNNYILMSGFDVDSEEVLREKLASAPILVENISQAILNKTHLKQYNKTLFPFVKSYIIYPLFIKYTCGKTSFRITEACNSCGLCEKICPTSNIRIKDGTPKWDTNCVQCLACINSCPTRAIEWGKITVNKGRYRFQA